MRVQLNDNNHIYTLNLPMIKCYLSKIRKIWNTWPGRSKKCMESTGWQSVSRKL